MDRDELLYILIVWGSGESTSTIGELAVCQIRSLIEAYSEKNDKNAFMQKLLLGSYSEVEAFNRAKKLHISSCLSARCLSRRDAGRPGMNMR